MTRKQGNPKGRKTNKEYGREFEYLTHDDVTKLMDTCSQLGANQEMYRGMIHLMFTCAMRVSEALGVQWSQVNFHKKLIHVVREKGGTPSVLPLSDEQIQFFIYMKERVRFESDFVFVNPFTRSPYKRDTVQKAVKNLGILAGMGDNFHPHQFRHAAGHYLTNEADAPERIIQALFGHKNIASTARYTQVNNKKFIGLFDGFEKGLVA